MDRVQLRPARTKTPDNPWFSSKLRTPNHLSKNGWSKQPHKSRPPHLERARLRRQFGHSQDRVIVRRGAGASRGGGPELLHLEDVEKEGGDRNEVPGRTRQVVEHADALEAQREVAGGGDQPGGGGYDLG